MTTRNTETQNDRLLAALRAGPLTIREVEAMGIRRASARIHNLRARGAVIARVSFGRESAYLLQKEPDHVGAL